MKNIKKVVITAGGLGTRLLPFTKSIAKEMLPIINKPNIEYLLKEAKESGIKEAIFIVNEKKPEIRKYFKKDKELLKFLKENNKNNEIEIVNEIGFGLKIKFVYQQKPLGLANAIYCAKKEIKKDDFALILGDDLLFSKTPVLSQLIEQYNKYHESIIGLQKIDINDSSKYGIVGFSKKLNSKTFLLDKMKEKPKTNEAYSNLAIVGRYIFKNEIFDYIEKTKIGFNNEYQLTDSMILMLNDNKKMYGYLFDAIRFDTGNKLGYSKAFIYYALHDKEIGNDIKDYLKKIK